MKLKLKITRHTSESELIHLGNFFTALGLNRGAHVTSGLTAPTDPAELDEGEVVVVATPGEQQVAEAPATAGTEAPKRRRRSKAEIEAEAQATKPEPVGGGDVIEPKDQAKPNPEPDYSAPAEAGNADPAPTPDAQQPATQPSETASTTPASASPYEPVGPVTHADAQKQAIDAARRHGPEKVKAIIAEFEGAAKIADLKEGDLASFIGKLQALAVAA